MKFIPIPTLASAHLLHMQWGESESLRRLLQLAYRNGARTVVAQAGPISDEWAQENKALFSDIAEYLDGDPSLLLFLRGEVVDGEGIAKAVEDRGVLGYAILRPGPLRSVVEGFITPNQSSDVHFITCQADRSFDIAGDGQPITISLKGLPFMQQDGIVSRCADASLWIATSLVAGAHPDWHDCSVVTHDLVHDALQFAPAVASRRLPSGGLGFDEMMLVLERNGYDPIPYVFRTEEERNKSDQLVYRWVESGIPVILSLALEDAAHTVVVCGHTFDPDAWWPGARTDYFPKLAAEEHWLSSSLWAVQYLLLDDNYGAALAMTRGSLRTRTLAAIVPLPKSAKVYLHAEDAETLVAGLIFALRGSLNIPGKKQPQWLDWLVSAAMGKPRHRFVLRTFLARGSDVVDHLQKAGYPKKLADFSKNLSLPDTVWVSEISLPAIYGDTLKVGEVILDPKVPNGFHRKGTESMLWVNLVGQVWVPSSNTTFTYAGFSDPVPLFDRWLGK